MFSMIPLLLPLFGLAHGQGACSQQGIDDCAANSRICGVSDDGEACGPCQEGFVEWQARDLCLNIEDLNVTAFLEEYLPVYRKESREAPVDRLALLKAAAQYISDFNAQNPDAKYELGLTPWSADTEIEWEQRSGFFYVNVTGAEYANYELPALQKATSFSRADEELPQKVDWVAEGAVTYVKDQGRCGCCWAVSLVGALEGAAAVNASNNGYLQSLSFQQYISCNTDNLACDGGNLIVGIAYAWLNEFGGVSRNNEYGFTDFNGKATEECKLDEEKTPLAVQIDDPVIVLDLGPFPTLQERVRIMKEAVAKQPVSMSIKSKCQTLSNYRKGILTDDGDCACDVVGCVLDHAVLMVGYDDTSDPPSWKVKNSWGDKWGEGGYFRVAQTEKGTYGLFGVVSHGVVPRVAFNVTSQVKDVQQDTTLEPWAIILIVVACICACICVGGIAKQVMVNSPDVPAADEEKMNSPEAPVDEEN